MTEDEIHDLGSRIAADVMGNDHLSHKLDEQQADEVHGHIQEAVVRALCDTALSRRAEPVGWQHRGRIADGPWSDWRPGRNHNFDTAEGHEFEERPVYASPSPATGAMVKPLEWTQTPGREHPEWIALTNIGKDYRVFEAWWGKEDKWGYVSEGGFHHTPDEAKAAAQADYEQRILSALTSSGNADPAVEIDEAMVERAMKAFAVVAHNMAPEAYDLDRAAAAGHPKGQRALALSIEAMQSALTAALKGAQP